MWPQVAIAGLGFARRHRGLIVASMCCTMTLFLLPLIVAAGIAGGSARSSPSGGATCTPGATGGPAVAADGSPSILGPSTLTGAQIAVWWRATSYPDPARTVGVDIGTLAGWYVAQGTVDGVRGDLAFAQAVVETGGFTSSDATGRFNFAGIGHPGLAPGAPFATAFEGVVAQTQLLAEVAEGPAVTFAEGRVAPAWGGPRVTSWAGLAGTWAASPDYWQAISGVYGRMLTGTGLVPAVGGPVMVAASCAAAAATLTMTAPNVVRAAIAFALSKVGLPYVWGGTGPAGYDCSGLIQAAWASVGVGLPRTTFEQVNVGAEVSRADLAPGDTVFPESGPAPGHEQMYLGGGMVVEAQQTGVPIHVVPLGAVGSARRVVAWDPAVLTSATGGPVGVPGPWHPIFDDEFTTSGLDESKWQPRRGCGAGAYASPYASFEGAYYAPANATVEGGALALAVRQGGGAGYGATAATVESGCAFSFTYGYAEARIWVPDVRGTWPAFWLSAVQGWPPETDIFEFGQHSLDPGVPTVTYHWPGPGGAGGTQTAYGDGHVSGAWHTFGMLWTPTLEQVYLDGRAGPAETDPGSVAHQAMQVILTLTTYGNAYDGAIPDGTAMLVDYVRVWQAGG